MKKISILLTTLAILIVSGFISCKKEENDPNQNPPVITLQSGTGYISSDKNVAVKDSLRFGIRASSNSTTGAALTGLAFARTFNGQTVDTTYVLSTYNVDLVTIAHSAVGKETFAFAVTDAKGASASVKVVITTFIPGSVNMKSSVFDPEKIEKDRRKIWIIQ